MLAAAIASLAVLTVAVTLGGRWILGWLGTGFDPAKLDLAASLFYVVVGIILVNGLSGVAAAVLDARERFAVTSTAALAVPAGTFAVLLMLAPRWGIFALAAGTLVGFTAELALLIAGLGRHGLWQWPRLSGFDDDLRRVAHQYAPAALAALFASSSLVVDQSLAASLSSGNVSVLMYGNKIIALVIAIVAVNLSTVLFPKFSRMIVAREWDVLERTITTYGWGILAGAVPAVALFAHFSEPLVRLLFQRGASRPKRPARWPTCSFATWPNCRLPCWSCSATGCWPASRGTAWCWRSGQSTCC